MKTKQLFLIFIIAALLQAAIPLNMIYESEMTERHGTEFKFKTVPIDPVDPLRGKYIILNYDIASYKIADTTLQGGDRIYVTLTNDKKGFAEIVNVLYDKPEGTGNYVIAEVGYNYGNRIAIEFPFDRFYMEESKAPKAEAVYAKYSSGTKNALPAYALVSVRNGTAMVKDVIVDSVPIREYVVRQRSVKK